jgi:flagellar hook-associated protein FlgK
LATLASIMLRRASARCGALPLIPTRARRRRAACISSKASQAAGRLADAVARRDDAVNRRDSFSGVNIDEELAQMVVLQNSYSAAARVVSTATQMYDTLLQMVG